MSGIVLEKLLMLFHSQSHHYNSNTSTITKQTISIPNNILLSFSHSQQMQTASCPKFHKLLFLPPPNASSSSSSSLGGSPSSGAEQLLDAKTKKKKRLAGIDQDQLLDPVQLADQDSCFCEFKGLLIHHKVYQCEAESQHPKPTASFKLPLPIILLHGFGASVFSWSRIMKPLAELTASKVLAFDRPAFGLTSRPPSDNTKPLNPYSMAFSVLATLYFIDFLAADKAVLVGHSAGSLVAVNSYFEAPEHVAALILVAPAVFAPLAIHKIAEENKSGRDKQIEGDRSNSKMLQEPFIKIFDILCRFTSFITQAITGMVKRMTSMLNSLYKKALSAILLSALGVMLIRMIIDKFGIAAVRNAWYDSNQVTEHVVNGYTKPLRAKGWDRALAEFTAETLSSTESESKPPLSKRLHEISCPVLIVTGDNDRIVPSWNAKRLSEAIPGSCLEVIKNCGHLPHEEKTAEFVSVVNEFLQRAFGDQKELSLQAAA